MLSYDLDTKEIEKNYIYLCDSSNELMLNIYNRIRDLTFNKLTKHATDVHEKKYPQAVFSPVSFPFPQFFFSIN